MQILIVEDNLADQVLFRECVGFFDKAVTLNFASDGVEALEFLRAVGRYAQRPRPHLVLLDLSLPRKDGRTVLAEMKNDPQLKDIPVIVMSTSSSTDDVSAVQALGAVRYVVKPNDLEAYGRLVGELVDYGHQLPTVSGGT